jgi:steroid delta-isomerase-like uncharacterized protein
MSEATIQITSSEEVVLTVLTHLRNGRIDDAIAQYSDEFRFEDHGIGVQFKDKERLTEFFQKARELYPDSLLQADNTFVAEDHVIMEWTLQFTLTEPFFGGLSRKVPVTVHGASVVRVDDDKITGWADYYDGLISRRTALAAHFEEWDGI